MRASIRVKRSVATTDSLDAAWLRTIREHDHAWVWWDAASGKAAAMALDADDDGEVYDGRNWSPYAPEVTRLLGPPVAGEDCYTAQYAVPDAAADAAVASIQKIAGAGVVEVKFPPPSAMLPGAAADVLQRLRGGAGAGRGFWASSARSRRLAGWRTRGSVVPRRPFSVKCA